MSAASATLRVLDAAFGWGWNLGWGVPGKGRPSPFELAAIDSETAEAIKKAGGGQTEVEQARREAAAVQLLNQPQKGCFSSVENLLVCADRTRKVVTVLVVLGVAVIAAPYVARAYREVKKSFK